MVTLRAQSATNSLISRTSQPNTSQHPPPPHPPRTPPPTTTPTIIGGSCHKYHLLSRQKRVCCDKIIFRCDKTYACRDKSFLATNTFSSRQHFCRNKQNFVATKVLSQQAYFCCANTCLSRQNTSFVATKVCLSRQHLCIFCRHKTFVATKNL